MMLTLRNIVRVADDQRAIMDRRFKVTRVIASYLGDDGEEYRKSFEAKDYPIVPKQGTHNELNSLKIQYK